MARNISKENYLYWQKYEPGTIPSVPQDPPEELLKNNVTKILDVGTGDGVLAEKLALKGFDVYGIDVAQNIINENKKRQSKVNYIIQDITTQTEFSDNTFDLITFRFTLTNIHKDSWQKLNKEIVRILKSSGKVWVLEPLVSESYKKRYKLASHFVDDKNCVYVFNDKTLADKINTEEELQAARQKGEVSRIVKHYTVDELKEIFSDLTLIDNRTINVTSPSGFDIKTFEGVFQK